MSTDIIASKSPPDAPVSKAPRPAAKFAALVTRARTPVNVQALRVRFALSAAARRAASSPSCAQRFKASSSS